MGGKSTYMRQNALLGESWHKWEVLYHAKKAATAYF